MAVADAVMLKTMRDFRGSLTVAEKLPFEIKRAYWLHEVPLGEKRGGHAMREGRRLMVAVSGSFVAMVNDEFILMDDPTIALKIEPLSWVELSHFSPGAVCLVLSSKEHDESDVICTREQLAEARA